MRGWKYWSLSNPGVRDRIEDIREEIHGDVGQANRQDAALHQVVVAVRDCLDGEAADAGPGEDGLGHNRAGEQGSELQSENSDDWDHGVAQGVAIDDGAFGQAFGAGGSNVVLAKFFQHRGADHAGQNGGECSTHGDGWKNEIRERAGPGYGQPSYFDCEDENENGAERKVGEREAEEADDGEQAIVPTVAAVGRTNAGRDRQNDGNEERGESELKRVGIALPEQVRHALVIAEGWTEIAVEDSFPVVKILFAERRIEAIGVACGGDVGGWRAFAEHLLNGVAGDEMDEQKDEADHQPNDWERVEDALEKQAHGSV